MPIFLPHTRRVENAGIGLGHIAFAVNDNDGRGDEMDKEVDVRTKAVFCHCMIVVVLPLEAGYIHDGNIHVNTTFGGAKLAFCSILQ